MSEDLPKQELLIKLLKMTTSTNDGEALIALRKANELLLSAGWDWEKLIHAKIRVVADPFASVPSPARKGNDSTFPSRPKPPPQPRQAPFSTPPVYSGGSGGSTRQAPPTYPAPPPPRPRTPPPPLSAKTNMYSGWCYCCGDPVDSKAGWIFDPSTISRGARSKWQILCDSCNKDQHRVVGPLAAPRKRQMVSGATPSLGDI